MQIAAVLELAERKELPPLQRKVLDYLETHNDEVFSYRDEKLARGVKAKASAVGFTLWALQKKNLIDRQKAAGKVYFGSKEAVRELRRKLGIADEDPFERVDRIREQIRQRHGNIDVLGLLDDVREGR
jgi:hypothetical protein